ncbi:hypothetical protein M426DRAFT_24936 [Hypoxylon sp. CI-4A]|nr:hypothetical protein M426DRAFT_24936 [Hypoxylon sp. CI-4A]
MDHCLQGQRSYSHGVDETRQGGPLAEEPATYLGNEHIDEVGRNLNLTRALLGLGSWVPLLPMSADKPYLLGIVVANAPYSFGGHRNFNTVPVLRERLARSSDPEVFLLVSEWCKDGSETSRTLDDQKDKALCLWVFHFVIVGGAERRGGK